MICIALGCGCNAVPDLEDEGQLTLYSIDGKRSKPNQNPEGLETFHAYPVLGKMDVTDRQQRRELLAALNKGIAEGKQTMKCFWPRHAFRIVSRGTTTDYLICFECNHVHIYSDGPVTVKPIDREQQSVLDKYLKDAGIPLAP